MEIITEKDVEYKYVVEYRDCYTREKPYKADFKSYDMAVGFLMALIVSGGFRIEGFKTNKDYAQMCINNK